MAERTPIATAGAARPRPAVTADGWVDLSQPLFNGMPGAAAHGAPCFSVEELVSDTTAGRVVARITHLDMGAHHGTHVDAAIHFVPGGRTIDEYPLDAFAGDGVVLDVRREGVVALDADELAAARPEIGHGDVVLLWFGYAARFREAAYADHPYLTAGAGEWLLERGIALLGVDTITPDLPGAHRPEGFAFPVHRTLLGADVPIVENLGPGLATLAGRRIAFRAAPFAIAGGDASPIVPLARGLDD